MAPFDEQFLKSVQGTKFHDLHGTYISEVGKPWPGNAQIVIVTAWNPFFRKAPDAQNEANNLELKKFLLAQGKKIQEINAWWPDGTNFEHSFVVEDLSPGEARALCLQFQQSAYFWAARNKPIQLVIRLPTSGQT